MISMNRHNFQSFFFLFAVLILARGCSDLNRKAIPGSSASKPKPEQLQGADYDRHGGADAYYGRGDNPHSGYYVNPDFYSATSSKTLTLIPHFKTMQQTTEWSCGDACALMVLRHFGCGMNLTEWDLAVKLHSMADRNRPDAKPGSAKDYADFGTKIDNLYRCFNSEATLKVAESSYRTAFAKNDLVKAGDLFPECDRGNLYPQFDSAEAFEKWLLPHLQADRPVLAEWSDWDGHWVVIIGVDNNGTPDFIADDILIFADPYDTSDHWQDGYSIAPLERFFSMWKDRAVALKPYQLQPFIVVEKR